MVVIPSVSLLQSESPSDTFVKFIGFDIAELRKILSKPVTSPKLLDFTYICLDILVRASSFFFLSSFVKLSGSQPQAFKKSRSFVGYPEKEYGMKTSADVVSIQTRGGERGSRLDLEPRSGILE